MKLFLREAQRLENADAASQMVAIRTAVFGDERAVKSMLKKLDG